MTNESKSLFPPRERYIIADALAALDADAWWHWIKAGRLFGGKS